MNKNEITIRTDIRPGDIGMITYLLTWYFI